MDGISPVYTDREAFIEHYGIPGMKWGKRRAKAVDAEPDDPDYAEARATLKKPLRKVSNKELQNLQTRMNLEQKYSQINKANTPSAKVDRVVKSVLAVGATAGGLYALYNSKHGQAAIQVGKKVLEKAIANRSGVKAGIDALVKAST